MVGGTVVIVVALGIQMMSLLEDKVASLLAGAVDEGFAGVASEFAGCAFLVVVVVLIIRRRTSSKCV